MTLKGDYSDLTSYNIGDVVRFNGVFYHKQNACAAGTPPTDTLYWGKLEQDKSDVLNMLMNGGMLTTASLYNGLSSTTSGKALDSRQGKALKEMILDISPDAKTIRLASSTASSDKVFDITVDDDGDLTATEYTPSAGT